MRIGLYNLEPKIVNSAMMRVSRWHKDNGDEVEFYEAWKGRDYYDKIYIFSIFEFTPKKNLPKGSICGGTGFDLTTTLPKEIENSDYDWSLYLDCDYSLVWFSTGCYRTDHKFCIVREKEGCVKSVTPKNINPKGTWIKVMDNNFFSNPEWRNAITQLKDWKQPLDFQGVDARLLNEEQCNALLTLKHCKQIKIAWDNPKEDMLKHFKRIIKYIKPYRLMCYVLIGYWSSEAEDIMRVEALRKLKIDPFVMPFNKSDPYQKAYARYVNHKAIFKSHTWEEYKKEYNVKY